MSPEENKAILVRAVEELNRGNLEIIGRLFSPTFASTHHTIRNGRAVLKVRGK